MLSEYPLQLYFTGKFGSGGVEKKKISEIRAIHQIQLHIQPLQEFSLTAAGAQSCFVSLFVYVTLWRCWWFFVFQKEDLLLICCKVVELVCFWWAICASDLNKDHCSKLLSLFVGLFICPFHVRGNETTEQTGTIISAKTHLFTFRPRVTFQTRKTGRTLNNNSTS